MLSSSVRRFSHLFLLVTLSLIPFAAPPARAQEGKTTTLELKTPVGREIGGGESHDYQFALQAGQFLHLSWKQQKLGLVLTISGPDGKPLLSFRPEPRSES